MRTFQQIFFLSSIFLLLLLLSSLCLCEKFICSRFIFLLLSTIFARYCLVWCQKYFELKLCHEWIGWLCESFRFSYCMFDLDGAPHTATNSPESNFEAQLNVFMAFLCFCCPIITTFSKLNTISKLCFKLHLMKLIIFLVCCKTMHSKNASVTLFIEEERMRIENWKIKTIK